MTKLMQRKAVSTPLGLSMGVSTSIFVVAMMLSLMAKLIQMEIIPEEKLGHGIMVTLLTASFTGSIIAAASVKRRKGMICMLTGLLFLGMLLAMTALFFGGQYSSVGVTALLILGGSGAGALTSTRERKKKKTKIHRAR